MKNILLPLFLFLGLISSAQESNDHYLVINPKGHKSNIRGLEISADGKQIISCSFDKTIKVWDAETGDSMGRGDR
jgi:WD40 repeat protein